MNEDDIVIVHGEEGTKLASQDKGIYVVIDVLRASTTIINGLNNGARMYIPCLTEKMSLQTKKNYPNALLAGERDAIKLKGFQLGNSPLEHIPSKVNDRNVIFTSSNCTRIVNILLKKKPVMLIGALVNYETLKEIILEYYRKLEYKIYLISVGDMRDSENEDYITAQIIKQSLLGETEFDANEIEKKIKKTYHAQFLIERGFDEDVNFCSKLNTHKTVPIFKNNGFIKYNLK